MHCRYPPLAFVWLALSGCLALAVAVTAGTPPAARAQQLDPKVLRQSPTPLPQRSPAAVPRAKTSCAEFGAGFVRAPGSDTCVRAGGGIDIGAGATRR